MKLALRMVIKISLEEKEKSYGERNGGLWLRIKKGQGIENKIRTRVGTTLIVSIKIWLNFSNGSHGSIGKRVKPIFHYRCT